MTTFPNPFRPVAHYITERFQQQAVTLSTVIGGALGFPTKSQRNLDVFWRYFTDIAVVHAAIQETVRSSAAIPFLVETFRNGRWVREPDDHPVHVRLETPNDQQDGVSFRERWDTEFMVTGNGIVAELGNMAPGEIGPLFVLPTRHVFVTRDKMHNISEFVFDPEKRHGGIRPTLFNRPSEKALTVPRANVIHRMYTADPDMPDWGISAMAAVVDDIVAEININTYIQNFFKSGAVPPYLLTTETTVNEEQRRAMQRQWQQMSGGVDNAWKLAVMDGTKGELRRLGLAAGSREVGLFDLRKTVQANILSGLNVPPIVVGAVVGLEHATYTNYPEARQAMHEENTDPMVTKRDATVTVFIQRRLQRKDIRVRGDTSNVLAVQHRNHEKSAQVLSEVSGSLITPNEGRAVMGRQPTSGGDVLLVPLNTERVDTSVELADVSLISAYRMKLIAHDLGDPDKTAAHVALVLKATQDAVGKPVIVSPATVMRSLPRRAENESKAQYARRIVQRTQSLALQSVEAREQETV